ncbi:cytochrome P450 oxidoreductase [Penicillium brasilianum]|uniref:Cytochrome P450 oxidoreductase n=1 Tax=Penicillium brasilianum TaxID=104259 RepID=A0A1S9RKV0_PENBI|nr:cytochrome P450 oxidoreductase [Penicillium brasilianum]
MALHVSTHAYPVYAIIAALLLLLLRNRFRKDLRDIPGPTLAKYTRLWKLHNIWKGDHHNIAISLHRKHGDLVRIGPKHISVGDPKAIPIIYGLNKGFTKTAFYPIQCISWNKKPQMNLFSDRDEQHHREQKRLVANAYSLSSLLEMEPGVDSCTQIFLDKLGSFADRKEPVDLGAWLQYYSFDVIGEFVFAKKLGFLEEGQDVDGMIQAIQGMLFYASLCGQVPEMHHVLLGNPLFPIFLPQMETWNSVVTFSLKAINSRSSLKRDGELEKEALEVGKDMMSKWMAVHQLNPEKMTTTDVMVHLSANVFAGSDTTAIALRAVFYFLLRNPTVMLKVQEEIGNATREGKLSDPISYRQSMTHLPYLGAVIKEAMRLHPSTGLIMERHVPSEGAIICGKQIPAGTVVGINAWVVHRDPKVFENPDSFTPERWLDSSSEKLKEMEQSFFVFGAGARTCLGKNISLTEMHKVIPQLLRKFEIKLHNPEEEWKTKNVWFVQQEGLICDIRRRT